MGIFDRFRSGPSKKQTPASLQSATTNQDGTPQARHRKLRQESSVPPDRKARRRNSIDELKGIPFESTVARQAPRRKLTKRRGTVSGTAVPLQEIRPSGSQHENGVLWTQEDPDKCDHDLASTQTPTDSVAQPPIAEADTPQDLPASNDSHEGNDTAMLSPTAMRYDDPLPLAAPSVPPANDDVPPSSEIPSSPTGHALGIRRRSSSFFRNPFRSVSRLSTANDPENHEAAFTLHSFRHVNGISADEPETAPTLRINTDVGRSSQAIPLPSSMPPEEGNHPLISPITLISPRPGMSRPPSVSASLGSRDDFSPSARVTVAAFRKGLRRPSDVQPPRSDIGHGGSDDDFVSFEVLRRRLRANSVGAASLSSMELQSQMSHDEPTTSETQTDRLHDGSLEHLKSDEVESPTAKGHPQPRSVSASSTAPDSTRPGARPAPPVSALDLPERGQTPDSLLMDAFDAPAASASTVLDDPLRLLDTLPGLSSFWSRRETEASSSPHGLPGAFDMDTVEKAPVSGTLLDASQSPAVKMRPPIGQRLARITSGLSDLVILDPSTFRAEASSAADASPSPARHSPGGMAEAASSSRVSAPVTGSEGEMSIEDEQLDESAPPFSAVEIERGMKPSTPRRRSTRAPSGPRPLRKQRLSVTTSTSPRVNATLSDVSPSSPSSRDAIFASKADATRPNPETADLSELVRSEEPSSSLMRAMSIQLGQPLPPSRSMTVSSDLVLIPASTSAASNLAEGTASDQDFALTPPSISMLDTGSLASTRSVFTGEESLMIATPRDSMLGCRHVPLALIAAGDTHPLEDEDLAPPETPSPLSGPTEDTR